MYRLNVTQEHMLSYFIRVYTCMSIYSDALWRVYRDVWMLFVDLSRTCDKHTQV